MGNQPALTENHFINIKPIQKNGIDLQSVATTEQSLSMNEFSFFAEIMPIGIAKTNVTSGGATAMALQVVMLNQYAQELGYSPYAAYCDQNESGMTLDRPSMQKLLADIRAGYVQRIIVKDLSRFARTFFHMDDLFCLFREHGIEVISISEGGTVDLMWALGFADAVISLAKKRKKRVSRVMIV